MFFFKKCVVGRAKEKGGRRKKDAPADNDDETSGAPVQTVAWQTVDQYVAAMVNLYETMRRGVAEKKRIEFMDRGIGEFKLTLGGNWALISAAGTYLDGHNTVQ